MTAAPFADPLIAEAWRRRRHRRLRWLAALAAGAALGAGAYLGLANGSPAGAPAGSGGVAPAGLGLAGSPYLGVACPGVANVTTCGRVGVAVWLSRAAGEVDATLAGVHVRLRPPPPHAQGGSWHGFVHLPLAALGLPRTWFGSSPAKTLLLRLRVRYGTVWRAGRVAVPLSPGWG